MKSLFYLLLIGLIFLCFSKGLEFCFKGDVSVAGFNFKSGCQQFKLAILK